MGRLGERRAASLNAATAPGQQGPAAVLAGSAEQAAPALLGAVVHAGGVSIRLTEVEAYGDASDPGSHARHGRTARTAAMFGPPGTLYVYFSYGMHWCVNVVCAPVEVAGAVLLRAGEVVDGVERAAGRRPGAAVRDWARGPARLARCLGLTGPDSGRRLAVSWPAVPVAGWSSGPRVGVAGAGAGREWRFWLAGEPTVSAYRAAARPGGGGRAGSPG